jgi:hypothetical protein
VRHGGCGAARTACCCERRRSQDASPPPRRPLACARGMYEVQGRGAATGARCP